MIEELTEERLNRYGIRDSESQLSLQIVNKGAFAVLRDRNEIHTDIDAYRIYYLRNPERPCFPLWELNLIPEYFSMAFKNFAEEQKKLAGVTYDQTLALNLFIKAERKKVKGTMSTNQKQLEKFGHVVAHLQKDQERYEHYLGWLKRLKRKVKNHQIDASELLSDSPSTLLTEENDFIRSSIEEYFEEFKPLTLPEDYIRLIDSYEQYCKNGSFPPPIKPIRFRGKVTKKKLGWAIREVLFSCNKQITVEVLNFSQKFFPQFANDQFEPTAFRNSNLYKYHCTKP